MLTAIQLFLSGAAGRRYRKRILRERYQLELNQVDVKDDNFGKNDGLLFKNLRLRARWRWYLAFNLIKNPSLQNEHLKKHIYLEEAKKEREQMEKEQGGVENGNFEMML